MKFLRFIGAWFFWAVGDTVSRVGLDHFETFADLYQWSMRVSADCQGVYGFSWWPWSEPKQWEQVDE